MLTSRCGPWAELVTQSAIKAALSGSISGSWAIGTFHGLSSENGRQVSSLMPPKKKLVPSRWAVGLAAGSLPVEVAVPWPSFIPVAQAETNKNSKMGQSNVRMSPLHTASPPKVQCASPRDLTAPLPRAADLGDNELMAQRTAVWRVRHAVVTLRAELDQTD
jgi:hypothetical protein